MAPSDHRAILSRCDRPKSEAFSAAPDRSAELRAELRLAREALADRRADGIAERKDALVGDEVVDDAALPPPAGNGGRLDDPQMSAGVGTGDAGLLGQFRHGFLPLLEELDQPHPQGLAQHTETAGNQG